MTFCGSLFSTKPDISLSIAAKRFSLRAVSRHPDKEREADIFAMNKLIPPERLKELLRNLNGFMLEPIIRFAEKINIAPGIVVGRLQHDGILPKSHGNKLKVFYSWE